MDSYIVRIQLMGSPSGEIYSKLHAHMRTLGFTETAPVVGGGTLDLPHATYWGSADSSAAAIAVNVRDSVQKNVWTKAKVLAIQYAHAHQADPT